MFYGAYPLTGSIKPGRLFRLCGWGVGGDSARGLKLNRDWISRFGVLEGAMPNSSLLHKGYIRIRSGNRLTQFKCAAMSSCSRSTFKGEVIDRSAGDISPPHSICIMERNWTVPTALI